MIDLQEDFTLISLASKIHKGPFLGMDWGKRHVGLAISDGDNKIAMPFQVVNAGAELRKALVLLWKDYNVKALIIGWPLHLNGQESALCATILRLAQRLRQDHNWPIALWDERLTSRGVASMSCDVKNIIDHHAAALILQSALDRWNFLTTNKTPMLETIPS